MAIRSEILILKGPLSGGLKRHIYDVK